MTFVAIFVMAQGRELSCRRADAQSLGSGDASRGARRSPEREYSCPIRRIFAFSTSRDMRRTISRFRADALTCRFVPEPVKGTTPKFDCELADGEVVKIKIRPHARDPRGNRRDPSSERARLRGRPGVLRSHAALRGLSANAVPGSAGRRDAAALAILRTDARLRHDANVRGCRGGAEIPRDIHRGGIDRGVGLHGAEVDRSEGRRRRPRRHRRAAV